MSMDKQVMAALRCIAEDAASVLRDAGLVEVSVMTRWGAEGGKGIPRWVITAYSSDGELTRLRGEVRDEQG